MAITSHWGKNTPLKNWFKHCRPWEGKCPVNVTSYFSCHIQIAKPPQDQGPALGQTRSPCTEVYWWTENGLPPVVKHGSPTCPPETPSGENHGGFWDINSPSIRDWSVGLEICIWSGRSSLHRMTHQNHQTTEFLDVTRGEKDGRARPVGPGC